MRITIETDDRDGIQVTQDGQKQFTASPEPTDAIDGGGPPADLIELSGGETALGGDDPEEAGFEGEATEPHLTDRGLSGDFADTPGDDAGAAPDWLEGVIEGSLKLEDTNTIDEL